MKVMRCDASCSQVDRDIESRGGDLIDTTVFQNESTCPPKLKRHTPDKTEYYESMDQVLEEGSSTVEEADNEEKDRETFENPISWEPAKEPVKEPVKDPVKEPTKEQKPEIFYWYISLAEYHDYTGFEVRELADRYGISPLRVKSYDEFWKIVRERSQGENLAEIQSIIREKWYYENRRR